MANFLAVLACFGIAAACTGAAPSDIGALRADFLPAGAGEGSAFLADFFAAVACFGIAAGCARAASAAGWGAATLADPRAAGAFFAACLTGVSGTGAGAVLRDAAARRGIGAGASAALGIDAFSTELSATAGVPLRPPDFALADLALADFALDLAPDFALALACDGIAAADTVAPATVDEAETPTVPLAPALAFADRAAFGAAVASAAGTTGASLFAARPRRFAAVSSAIDFNSLLSVPVGAGRPYGTVVAPKMSCDPASLRPW